MCIIHTWILNCRLIIVYSLIYKVYNEIKENKYSIFVLLAIKM